MKKTTRLVLILLLAALFVTSTVLLVACNNDKQEVLNNYSIGVTSVDGDFTLPKKIGPADEKTGEPKYDVTWSSSNTNAINIVDSGDEYTAKVTLGDDIVSVTLTAAIGNKTREYAVQVVALDASYFASHFEFEYDQATVYDDFPLPQETDEIQGKKATITWSVPEASKAYLRISDDGATCHVTPSGMRPNVRIVAHFHYNNNTEDVANTFRMFVYVEMDHQQEIDYWYNNQGVSMDLEGYVVAVAEDLAKSTYSNATFYMVDKDFNAGYYIYRVDATNEDKAAVKVGAYVKVTGTTNTNFSGLIETNSGGKIEFDASKNITEAELLKHVYAIDNDIISGVASTIYHESQLVSLTGWTVDEANDPPTKVENSSTLLKLSKKVGSGENDVVKINVQVSGYMGAHYAWGRSVETTDDNYKAIANKVKDSKGKTVDIIGVLGNYQGEFQVLAVKADWITVGEAAVEPSEYDVPGVKVKAAIAALHNQLDEKGISKVDENGKVVGNYIVVGNTDVVLNNVVEGVKVDYTLCWENPFVKIEKGTDTTTIKITPDDELHERAKMIVTYTYGEGDDAYTTFEYVSIETFKADPDTIVADELKEIKIKTDLERDKDYDLPLVGIVYAGVEISWELKSGSTLPEGVEFDGESITVNQLAKSGKFVLVATVKYGTKTLTKEYNFEVPELPEIMGEVKTDWVKLFPTLGWGTSYTSHNVKLGADLTADFTRANAQSSNINDRPVIATSASTEYVTLTLTNGGKDISSVKFEFKQWNSVKFNSMYIEYSLDGAEWKEVEGVGFKDNKDTDFVETLSATNIEAGAIAVRVAIKLTTSGNKQIALTATTINVRENANASKPHPCESKCEICGQCTNAECNEKACLTKCPGSHEPTNEFTKVSSTSGAPTGNYLLAMWIPDGSAAGGKYYYATGALTSDNYYFATTTNVAEAATLTIEAVNGQDGKYTIKNSDGKYLELFVSGTYVNSRLEDEASNYWAWNSDLGIFTTNLTVSDKANDYYLGAWGTYNVFRNSTVSNISGNNQAKIDVSQFVGFFGTKTEA